MLLKLSDRISDCLAHAADARERADATTDPKLKADFLDMELRWMRLVESYRFVEQADRFLQDVHTRKPRPAEASAQSGVLVITCPATGREFSTGILTDTENLARLPQMSTSSHCPYCKTEHAWWAKDAKLVGGLLKNGSVKVAADRPALATSLSDLIRIVTERTNGTARAAFYQADSNATHLHHVIGMPPAYARHVDGFPIGADSLACGLAASTRQPIITPDVTKDPRWKPWLWLANEFDYRACWSFPIETAAGRIVGTFAMYYREPCEATPRDLDQATVVIQAAALIMAPH